MCLTLAPLEGEPQHHHIRQIRQFEVRNTADGQKDPRLVQTRFLYVKSTLSTTALNRRVHAGLGLLSAFTTHSEQRAPQLGGRSNLPPMRTFKSSGIKACLSPTAMPESKKIAESTRFKNTDGHTTQFVLLRLHNVTVMCLRYLSLLPALRPNIKRCSYLSSASPAANKKN